MSEWHQPPEYILENWTEAKLLLMFVKRNDKLRAMSETTTKPRAKKPMQLSSDEFMEQQGAGVYIHRAKTGTA